MRSPKKVAVVAPAPLGDAFMVLLQSAPSIRPLAGAANVEALLSVLADEIPDVILLYVDEDAAGGNKGQVTSMHVSRSKAAWPDAFCVVVVKESQLREEVKSIGADVIFNAGVSPTRLLKTIDSYDPDETTKAVSTVEVADPTGKAITLEDQLKQLGKQDRWWQVWKKGAA